MGSIQSSRNYVDNLTETITRIIQENSQECTGNSSQINEIVSSGACESITIENVEFKNDASVDFTCMQRGDLNAKVASQMNIQLEQLAKNLLSGIPFHIFATQEARNFITNHVRLVTEIINRLNQDCYVNIAQYNGIRCEGKTKYMFVRNAKLSNLFKSMFKCAQEGETVADVVTQIEQFIRQTAISENKGLSFDFIFILLIIVIVGGAIFLLNKITDWKFLVIGLPILAILIYLLVAYFKNWWPFKSKFDDKKRKPDPPVPTPPAPKAVQDFQAQQAQLKQDQLWGQAELGLNRLQVTPEQYRQLKYGDAQIAFETPFGRPSTSRNCVMEVKPVRLNMQRAKPIIVK